MCKTIPCRSATSKYPLARSASPTKMKVAAHHETAAAGRTRRQNSRTTCMRMLSASRSQNGNTYWQLLAVRFSSVQRPPNRAGAPCHISSGPTSLRTGVKGVIQLPRPTVTSLATPAPTQILQPLSRCTGPTCNSCPTHLDMEIWALVWMATSSPMERRSSGPENRRRGRIGGCHPRSPRAGVTPMP